MAQVTTGCVYGCEGHRQEGHELAAEHPVVVVGRQRLIDNQGIAIVVPLTSTPPNHPVHWAVEIEDTNSYAYIRHVKSVHTSKIGRFLGQASPEEIDSIKDGLARNCSTPTTSAPRHWDWTYVQAAYGRQPYRTPAD